MLEKLYGGKLFASRSSCAEYCDSCVIFTCPASHLAELTGLLSEGRRILNLKEERAHSRAFVYDSDKIVNIEERKLINLSPLFLISSTSSALYATMSANFNYDPQEKVLQAYLNEALITIIGTRTPYDGGYL